MAAETLTPSDLTVQAGCYLDECHPGTSSFPPLFPANTGFTCTTRFRLRFKNEKSICISVLNTNIKANRILQDEPQIRAKATNLTSHEPRCAVWAHVFAPRSGLLGGDRNGTARWAAADTNRT